MSDLTLRLVKGSPLTNQEVDDNFSNLNADKYQSGDSPTFVDITADSIQVTGGDSTNWNTAYGWGDHSTAGYLTSYTETDPIYTASSWYTTTNNSINWDTAYSWGDHSAVGYLTSLTLDGLTDVSVSGATNGQSLVYNSTSGNWEASTPASTLGSLTDVSIAGVADGQALVYNSSTGEWEAGASSSTTVSTTPPVSPSAGDLWWNSESGQLKVYYTDVDGSQWVDAAASAATQNVTLSFPFYNSSSALDSIGLLSNQNLPFFKADGTQDNITVTS